VKIMGNLRMHCAENVGDDQPTSTGAGVKLYVLAVWGRSNTVKRNRTLNRGVDALDCDADNAPLVVREIYK
jgi:hypothetical protein